MGPGGDFNPEFQRVIYLLLIVCPLPPRCLCVGCVVVLVIGRAVCVAEIHLDENLHSPRGPKQAWYTVCCCSLCHSHVCWYRPVSASKVKPRPRVYLRRILSVHSE